MSENQTPVEIPEGERFKAGQVVRCTTESDTFDGRPGELYEISYGYAEAEERDEPDDPPYYIVDGVKTGEMGIAIPHANLEAYDFEKEGPISLPHSAEFVAIRRLILQVDATGEEDLREKMEEYAKEGHCEDFVMADEAPVVLVHEPYGHFSDVGPSDGHSWMVGDVFGTSKTWMRELGERLIAMSEEE